MKLLKLALFLSLFCFISITTTSCSGAKRAHKLPVETEKAISYTTPYFQAWVVPIKIGSDGVHIYIPNLQANNGATIDNVYFRNMSGKLKKGRALYEATLTRAAPDDRAQAAKDFPFDLLKSECVVSYIENGVTKYYLINKVLEREGVYYENGLPKDKM